jgi:hypothetical protein
MINKIQRIELIEYKYSPDYYRINGNPLHLFLNNIVKVFYSSYGFDYKPWLTNPIRNIENFFRKTIHGKGTPYEIDFTGSGTISRSLKITDWYLRTGGLR